MLQTLLLSLSAGSVTAGAGSSTAPGTRCHGHVFILHTDIRYMACDSWLLPVTKSMHVDRQWGLTAEDVPARPEGWGSGVRLVKAAGSSAPRPAASGVTMRMYRHPQPWLAHVVGEEVEAMSVDELLAPLRQFLVEAAATLGEGSRFHRALPLLAVPIVGAGLATQGLAGSSRSGEVVRAMLATLHAFTATHAVDVALCTLDEAAYGAAHNARRQEDASFRERAPPGSDEARYRAEVGRLAELFCRGRCSLFLGAGVSVNAGLPSWAQLLDLIAEELAYPSEDRAQLARLNPLEAASVLEGAAGGADALKAIAARIVGAAKRHSLQHALLAGLPFRGCVSTNYDDLLERAVRQAGGDPAGLKVAVHPA